MTPKEKAKELVDKFSDYTIKLNWRMKNDNAIECALIAVEQILEIDCFDMSEENFNNHIEYWTEVHNEIIKI